MLPITAGCLPSEKLPAVRSLLAKTRLVDFSGLLNMEHKRAKRQKLQAKADQEAATAAATAAAAAAATPAATTGSAPASVRSGTIGDVDADVDADDDGGDDAGDEAEAAGVELQAFQRQYRYYTCAGITNNLGIPVQHLTDEELRNIAPDVEGAAVDMSAVRKLEKALKMDSDDRICLEQPLTREQMERWTCAVCIESATNPILLCCGHYFCGRCIFAWGLSKIKQGLVNDETGDPAATCPTCQSKFDPLKMKRPSPVDLQRMAVAAKTWTGRAPSTSA